MGSLVHINSMIKYLDPNNYLPRWFLNIFFTTANKNWTSYPNPCHILPHTGGEQPAVKCFRLLQHPGFNGGFGQFAFQNLGAGNISGEPC